MVFKYKDTLALNINNGCRNKILNFWKQLEEELYSDEEIITLIIDELNELDDDISFNCLTVMFIDAYKFLNCKFKSGDISINELETLEFLKSFKNNNLIKDLDYYTDTFRTICKYFKQFAERNEFDKRVCFLNLDEEDNKFLESINLYHVIDLNQYNSFISTQRYVELSEEIFEKELENIYLNWDTVDNYVLNSISKFMKELYIKDYDNFHENFKDMVRLAYSYSKYLVDHTKVDISSTDEAKIVKKTENYDFSFLEQYCIRNADFLKDIISFYLDYSKHVEDSYCDETGKTVVFDDKDVKTYTKKLDEKIKIKLGIE